MADVCELRRRFRAAGNDHRNRSAFSSHLNQEIAEDPQIVELLLAAPEEQQLPVLLLAAVHSLVLTDPGLELGGRYPTVTAEPLDSDPVPAFARLCRDRAADLQAIISTRAVQTNEVGRCALLLPALVLIAEEVGALSLVDVGTSAGLNLHLDRYRYRYSPGGLVGPASPVLLECGTRGDVPIPEHVPLITSRVGLDQAPVDVTDPDDANWLMACVRPGQADRFERLRAAIGVAREHPVPLVRGDAIEQLPAIVREQRRVAHPVVTNSWVLNHLPPGRRTDDVERLDEIGRASDLTWVYAESPGLCEGLPFPEEVRQLHLTVVMMVRWRDGERFVSQIGTGHPHGYWFHHPNGAECGPAHISPS